MSACKFCSRQMQVKSDLLRCVDCGARSCEACLTDGSCPNCQPEALDQLLDGLDDAEDFVGDNY